MFAKRIIILPFAELDIKSTVEHFMGEEEGLDKKFISAINSSFNLISDNPTAYPIQKSKIRKAVVKNFPFCIYYVFIFDVIYVLAVFHDKRNPKVWKQSGSDTRKKPPKP